jgi:AraC-like DNA-binding protein
MSVAAFLNSVILLGSLQGFIIGILLFRSSKDKPSRKILAWLLLILALACLKIYLNNIGFTYTEIGALVDAFVPFMIIMPVGPLIYFYCKTELISDFSIQRKDRRHFYPVIIDLFHHASAVVFLLFILAGWVDSHENNFGNWFDTYNVYADIPRWISLSVYLLLSFRLLRNLRQQAESNGVPVPSFLWLKEFLWVFLAFDLLWLVYLIPYAIPKYTDVILSAVDWYPIYLPIVAIIYWLGIRGFLIGKKEMILSRKSASLTLTDEIADQTLTALQKAMTDDKLYIDAELNVTKLAKHLGTSSKIISAVLNQKLRKNFNEYVNEFRVAEVKDRLVKTENRKYTIASVAYECGFNSQPTFQRAFKSIVGVTPREFLQQNSDVA